MNHLSPKLGTRVSVRENWTGYQIFSIEICSMQEDLTAKSLKWRVVGDPLYEIAGYIIMRSPFP